MKRALPVLIVAGLAAILNGTFTLPARADCAGDLKTLRAELATVKDERRRQELQKLIEKAAKDDEAGRAQLCTEATQRAWTLLKG